MSRNEVNALIQLAYLYNAYGFPFLRYGQFFVGRFIKKPWPELFYEKDRGKATEMIKKWLEDNHYVNELPKPVFKIEEHNAPQSL